MSTNFISASAPIAAMVNSTNGSVFCDANMEIHRRTSASSVGDIGTMIKEVVSGKS